MKNTKKYYMNMRRLRYRMLVLVLGLGSSTLFAVNNVTLKSSYLGNGLFKYEMTVFNDPFLLEEKNSFHHPIFTNFIEVVEHSPNWMFTSYTNSFSLSYPEGNSDIGRPYRAYCIVRSSNTNYRVGSWPSSGVYVTGNLLPLGDRFGTPYSSDIALYIVMEALIPCSEEEADGSPAICERDFEMIPDVWINKITTLDKKPHGLQFLWDSDCTVLVQASTNLQEWIDVQHVLGSAPSTEWIAPEPLDVYGTFYRILLVAMGHHPELIEGASPQMESMDMTESHTTPSFQVEGMKHGKITVQIDTIPQARYVVSVKQAGSKATVKTIECIAQDEQTRIDVDVLDLPASATIEVTELQ